LNWWPYSAPAATVNATSFEPLQGAFMFWKFLNPQRLLDSLFDEGWCSLGLPEAHGLDLLGSVETASIS
jgi:hypothetical protein